VEWELFPLNADIANGGTLEMKMGNLPNKTLGANPSNFPPSEISLNPGDLPSPGMAAIKHEPW